MDLPTGTDCTRGVAAGSICPRPAEVQVHLVDVATGKTNRRDVLCAVHAIEAAMLAFVNVTNPDLPRCTVILAPLD
jgi:hypothetical protein